mmetsp:Transcript_25221/g.57582  ORF Transcript_25221/g.57582 Transcript_25221/m.57582 type:complete len:200 (+) Transcript_25221:1146-1745(+)
MGYPRNSVGGSTVSSGVTISTSSPAILRYVSISLYRFEYPLTCVKGVGSTISPTLIGGVERRSGTSCSTAVCVLSVSVIVIATLRFSVCRCHGMLFPPTDHDLGVSTSGLCKAAAPDVAAGSPRALKKAGMENPEVPWNMVAEHAMSSSTLVGIAPSIFFHFTLNLRDPCLPPSSRVQRCRNRRRLRTRCSQPCGKPLL